MTLNDLIEETGWTLVTEAADLEKEIEGAYCGDLLSWVMGNGEPGQAWITVQIHMNAVAVAKLREFSCIILADNAAITEDVIAKAEEEDLAIIESAIPVFETAKALVELGI
ncbi:MAG: AraC family transcriptional regulator [Firmicutes bacterium]|nr:AraC family transcriptional regulator [Bacillota bacterium]